MVKEFLGSSEYRQGLDCKAESTVDSPYGRYLRTYMKSLHRILFLSLSLVVLFGSLAFAQKTVHVRTYTRKDGTVVKAHNRAAPGTSNSSRSNSSSNSSRSSSSDSERPGIYTSTRARTVGVERDGHAKIKRRESAKHDFMVLHPCPVTGRMSGKCPGYVIDHVNPLACGGADDSSNMQWQTKEAAKAKDKWERKGCH